MHSAHGQAQAGQASQAFTATSLVNVLLPCMRLLWALAARMDARARVHAPPILAPRALHLMAVLVARALLLRPRHCAPPVAACFEALQCSLPGAANWCCGLRVVAVHGWCPLPQKHAEVLPI